MTEDDGLANGDDSIDVCDAPVLCLGGVAVDVVLLDVVHRLLLPPQLDGDDSEGALRLLLQFGLPPKAWSNSEE